jgi:Transposase DDE domain
VCGLTVIVRQHFTDSCWSVLCSSVTIRVIRVRELWTHRNMEAVHVWSSFVLWGNGYPFLKHDEALCLALLHISLFVPCRYARPMANTPCVVRYRVRNWRAYNRAMVNRGRLTIWFDEQAITGWRHTAPATGPGAPRLYADLAIECALVFKSVYHLSLRAAQGFLSSVVEVMKLALPIPDYSTVSRRQGVLQVPVFALPQSSPRHIVIDATGLRVYGVGEWRVWKHRVSRRRTWRKLHLGIDETTKEIVAAELTGSRVHDSQQLPSLLDQIRDPIDQVSGDGAYDTRTCDEAVLQRQATPTFIPRRTARLSSAQDSTAWRAARDRILQQIAVHGRSAWRMLSGYTRQSIAENTMFRFKQLFGGRL